jgi:hypothetical protein
MATTLADKHARKRQKRLRISPHAKGSTCPMTGKRQFDSEESAQTEIRKLKKLRAAQRNGHVEKRHYLCTTCLKFHLTSR